MTFGFGEKRCRKNLPLGDIYSTMSEDWQSVDDAIQRYGLPPAVEHRTAILAELEAEIAKEADEEGDQFLMRLLCAQLFCIGNVEDSLAVWAAKSCNFDTHCGIDVQLACGAGLDETKTFLAGQSSELAADALTYISECQETGDFDNFSREYWVNEHRRFYDVT